MNLHLICFLLIFLDVNVTMCSVKFKNIGDCYTNMNCGRGETNEICPLTFFCHENDAKNYFDHSSYYYCGQYWFYKNYVTEIIFENCDLPQIASNFFSLYSSVYLLSISDLGVESLESESFIGATNLITLEASEIKITEIPANLFKECSSLKYVDFSNNYLSYFDSSAFSDENQLAQLNLKNNNVHELSVLMFQRVLNLEFLDLSGNHIAEIPSFLFHNMEKLNHVTFSFNNITKIDRFAFSGAVNMIRLELAHNQISSLDRKYFDQSSNLTYLDISENRIAVLKADTMQFLTSLEHFNVAGNPLSKLHNTIFEKLISLKYLGLSRTNLSEIQMGTFSNLTKLEKLDLSGNKLKTLNANVLPSDLSQLEWFSIANNQLHRIDGFGSSQMYMKIAGIEDNKFRCSYLEKLFEIIKPQHMDRVLNRINCTDDDDAENEPNDEIELTTWPTADVSFPFSMTDGNDDDDVTTHSVAEFAKTTDGVHEVIRRKDNRMNNKLRPIYEKGVDNSLLVAVQKMHGDVKDHLFVMACCMVTGVVLTVIVLIWKVFLLRLRKGFRQTQVVYRVDDMEKCNTVDNVYESINVNRDENPLV